jgi:hypothetical protein
MLMYVHRGRASFKAVPAEKIAKQKAAANIYRCEKFRPERMEESRVARFLLVHDTKTGKMYQMNSKCTKWS